MTKIVVDAEFPKKMPNLTQVTQLCDSAGKVWGRFIPAFDLSAWEPASPAASPEELDRREQANEQRYTTAEVLAHLEKL